MPLALVNELRRRALSRKHQKKNYSRIRNRDDCASVFKVVQYDGQMFVHGRGAFVLVILLLTVSGCGDVSKSKVVGTYVRSQGVVTESLRLSEDGKFSQSIKTDDGKMWTLESAWKLKSFGVEFERFYFTYDVEKQVATVPPQLYSVTDGVWKDGVLVLSETDPYSFKQVSSEP
jgi:hypothetical protein